VTAANDEFQGVYEEALRRRDAGFPITERWLRQSYPKSWRRLLELLTIEDRLRDLPPPE